MKLSDAVPAIKVDPKTYRITADGEDMICKPADCPPLARLENCSNLRGRQRPKKLKTIPAAPRNRLCAWPAGQQRTGYGNHSICCTASNVGVD
jgi:hypothetical protein